MAYILEKIGNTYNLPKKYFTCDAKSDLDGISLVDVPTGSEAYCILEEETYILDSNKQWHKKKIGEDLTGQVQADLSQTDSTQADYVKGVLRTEHLPEGYPYKEQETILDGTFEFADGGGAYMHQIADEGFTIVDGKSYTIIWDVETYQCVAITVDNVLVALGNLAIGGVGNDTGEPFLFIDYGNGQKVIGTNSTAATHMIIVRGEVAYPMASEFLPIESITETDPTVPAWAKAETKPSYDFSELTVNDPEAAKTVLAIEKGMILKRLNVQLPNSYGWNSITYGNGKFVAVEIRTDQAAYSEDGINWTTSTMPSSAKWNSVTYGNGKFVAITYNSDKAAYSEDGINWTASTMPSSAKWNSVTYGNGKFVAITSNSDKGAYSEDGISWTASTMASSEYWYSVTYGNGKFVAIILNSDKSAYSEDGITWKNTIEYLSQNNSNITENVRSTIGIPSYSTANNGQFLRVTDGIPTWTESLPTLTSPNGTKYQLTVSDDGTLSAVQV